MFLLALFGKAVSSAIIGMITKLATQSFVEYLILKIAESLVKKTSTTWDDEMLAKIEAVLKGDETKEEEK